MSLVLLLVGGAAVFVAAAYVAAARPEVYPALAGDQTVVGLGDPAAETFRGRPAGPVMGADWQMSTVEDLSAAEDLLDCLEAHGFSHRELVVLGNSTFAVRWR